MTTKKPSKEPSVKRRDGTGHLDPQYAADLRALGQHGSTSREEEVAFIRGTHTKDELAEELGESVIKSATTGADQGEEVFDQVVAEEGGGPFVKTTGATEFAKGTDRSNPRGAHREPFPRT